MNLKALSEHLGLSQTTVSRALNGYPEVAERTRKRVMEAASALGYRPNHAARGLATGKAGAIGYVMTTGPQVQSDPHFMEFLSGIGQCAMARGIDIHIAPCTAEDEEAAYRRLKTTRQVDGVFISSPLARDQRIALLKALDMPFILHGRSEGVAETFSYMDIDNRGAFHDATRLLVQMGHRRIALINGQAGMTFAAHRSAGFLNALGEAGIVSAPGAIRYGQMNEEHGYRSTIDLLDSGEPPTALACSSIIVALGAIRALGDRGLTAGQDMSVIAHDDVFPYLKPENFRVPLTCTRSSIRDAGIRIAERLLSIITGEEDTAVGEVWPVELVVRASVAPPPTA